MLAPRWYVRVSTIWFTDGFVVITGEIGAGKTTLIETFLRELQTDAAEGQKIKSQTQLSPTAFLQTVLVQFGFSPFTMKKPEVLTTLNQFLVDQYIAGHKVLLIVDEAQNFEPLACWRKYACCRASRPPRKRPCASF